jgi:hypothetical protein
MPYAKHAANDLSLRNKHDVNIIVSKLRMEKITRATDECSRATSRSEDAISAGLHQPTGNVNVCQPHKT